MDPPPPPPPPMLLYVHSWPVATLVQIVFMFNLFMQTFGISSHKEHLTSHSPPFGTESKTFEKVSDVVESRVWFASKNLTYRRMH